jgi:hypothetical protein
MGFDPRDFEINGRLIDGLGIPILVIQEGGYRYFIFRNREYWGGSGSINLLTRHPGWRYHVS